MRNLLLFFLIISCASCRIQQADITKNEIFVQDQKYFGVKSPQGKVLLPPTYHRIVPYFDVQKLYYEQDDSALPLKPYPYYIVEDASKKLGIFATNGRKVFDFITADALEIDLPTQTVVVSLKLAEGGRQAKLYHLNGKIADTTSYQNIGYFPDHPLIILQKVKRKEVYLLHLDQQLKAGPYDHFNLWEPYAMLAVHYEEQWGLLDATGKQILPMSYSRLWMMNDEYTQNTLFVKATKPENTTFIGGATLADGKTRILLDNALNEYAIIVNGRDISIVQREE